MSPSADSPADTIAAPATPPGKGALAIVRVSGADSARVWKKCFRPAAGPEPPVRRACHGFWTAPATGEAIDEVVAVFYRGPASFTGEDSIEITCHGADLIVERLADACFQAGARAALPGEFTRRAFENGKIDLLQARAVAELIESETDEARRQALVRLRGGLGDKVREAEGALLDAAALIEAYLDFPEEDIGPEDAGRVGRQLETARGILEALLATHRRGRLLQKGARVAIVGRPNAGKSSLFNALLGASRAIVSPHPGTTRDTVEARLDLGGLAATLVDTAGLRPDPGHEVEALGIERAREELSLAQLAVWTLNPEESLDAQIAEALALAEEARANGSGPGPESSLAVFSKDDLIPGAEASLGPAGRENLGRLSAREPLAACDSDPAGVSRLASAMRQALAGESGGGLAGGSGVLCADAGQANLLAGALEALGRAESAFDANAGGELAMADLDEALDSLARLTGTSVREETLSRIFRQFCLGK